jgi:tripartite-type tricarboxylate transporter receptor subunit TctC
MPVIRSLLTFALPATLALGTTVAWCQPYPAKTIRIVTLGAGGTNDFVARFLADRLTVPLAQSLIVDNRPGNFAAPEFVSKAPGDGYTLLVSGSVLWISSLMQSVSFNPATDFAPISLVGRSPMILAVHPSLRVKSVSELIALAKAKPGELNLASPGIGGNTHLAGELFKSMSATNIVHVPYKGGAAALVDLLSGQVHMTIDGLVLLAHVKSGKLRALAVTSAQPSALYPGLTTMATAGLPGFEAVPVYGVWAPANTPAAIVNRLNQEIVRTVSQTDARDRLLNAGVDPGTTTPGEFETYIKTDTARWAKVIKEAGIRGN